MNKEEILKKSREENIKGDEYERKSKRDADFNANYTTSAILIIFWIMEYFKIINGSITFFGKYERPISLLFIMPFSSGWLAYNICRYRTQKKTVNLIMSILLIFLLCAIIVRTIIWW